jgi:hypothetical protein
MRTILAITLILILQSATATTGMIRGFVRSSEGVLLTEANVTIIGSTLGSASDEEGKYIIRSVKPGKYILKCSHIGFRDDIQRGVTVEADKFTDIDFALDPLEYNLPPIGVEGSANDFNSLMKTRDLGITTGFSTADVKEPELKGDIRVNTSLGFWERFRHFFHKLFN